jgi:hypothetical protein
MFSKRIRRFVVIARLALRGVPRTKPSPASPGGAATPVRVVPGRSLALGMLMLCFATAAPGFVPCTARASSPMRTADRLAAHLSARSVSPARRRTALRRALRWVNIPVISPEGRHLVLRGAAHSAAYLYSPELSALSARDPTTATLPASTVAGVLRRRHMPGASATRLKRSLRVGTRDAVRHPRAASARIALLVRALGLHHAHPENLARTSEHAPDELDPLQLFLLMADLSTATRATRQSVLAAHAAAVHIPNCEELNKAHNQGVVKGGKYAAGWVKPIAKFVKSAFLLGNLAHEAILSEGVRAGDFTNVRNTATHYGPADQPHPGALDTPGAPIVIKVFLLSTFDRQSKLVQCGELAGYKFPPKGPIPDVPVSWTGVRRSLRPDNYDQLRSHLKPESYVESASTDHNGVATLRGYPKDEPAGPIGPVEHEDGWVTVGFHENDLFGSDVGPIFDNLVQVHLSFPWRAEWHAPLALRYDAGFAQSGGNRNGRWNASADIPRLSMATAGDGTRATATAPLTFDGSFRYDFGEQPEGCDTRLTGWTVETGHHVAGQLSVAVERAPDGTYFLSAPQDALIQSPVLTSTEQTTLQGAGNCSGTWVDPPVDSPQDNSYLRRIHEGEGIQPVVSDFLAPSFAFAHMPLTATGATTATPGTVVASRHFDVTVSSLPIPGAETDLSGAEEWQLYVAKGP